MFIGGKTPAPGSGAPSLVDVSSRRNISRRIWSKSERELSNVGREGQTRRRSMVDLLGLTARINGGNSSPRRCTSTADSASSATLSIAGQSGSWLSGSVRCIGGASPSAAGLDVPIAFKPDAQVVLQAI